MTQYVGDRSSWTRQGPFWPCHTIFSVGGGQSRRPNRGLLSVERFSVRLNIVSGSFQYRGWSVEGSNRGLLLVEGFSFDFLILVLV